MTKIKKRIRLVGAKSIMHQEARSFTCKLGPEQRIKLRQDAAEFLPVARGGVRVSEAYWLQALVMVGHLLGPAIRANVAAHHPEVLAPAIVRRVDRGGRLRKKLKTKSKGTKASRIAAAVDDPDQDPTEIT